MDATVKMNLFQTRKDADLEFKLDEQKEIIDFEVVSLKSTHEWEVIEP